MSRLRTAVLAAALSAVAAPALVVSVADAAPTAPASSNVYVVRKGDYLISIASRMQVTLVDLLATNDLKVNSVILPGQQLVVPSGGVVPSATPAAPAGSGGPAVVKQNAAPSAASATYTVKQGDFLYGIATKLKIKLGDLLSLNGLTVTSVIHPGRQLIVPEGAVLTQAPTSTTNSTSSGGGSNGATVASQAPSASASAKIDTVIAFAKAQIGKPYIAYSMGPDGFDCSGLTTMAFKKVGINLPHWSVAQAQKGVPVDWVNDGIRAGDLVFTSHTNDPNAINHVGLAIDANRWIQAPRTGDVIRIGPLPSDEKIVAVRRVIN